MTDVHLGSLAVRAARRSRVVIIFTRCSDHLIDGCSVGGTMLEGTPWLAVEFGDRRP